jgi:predicted enzyme related to lactoylglutathione lyase
MSARLVVCNVPVDATHSEATLKFYGTLLGRNLIRSLSADKKAARYHAPTSAGVQLSLGPKISTKETVTCYFAVPDIQVAIRQLEASRGKLLVKPFPLPAIGGGGGGAAAGCSNQEFFGDPAPDMGSAAIFQDPAGNLVGIIQLNKTAEVWFQGEVTPAEIASYNHGAAIASKVFP